MEHAAEISPQVHERSIGPDLELKDFKENEEPKQHLKHENHETNKDLTKSAKNEINKKKTPAKDKQPISPINEKLAREPNCLQVCFKVSYFNLNS